MKGDITLDDLRGRVTVAVRSAKDWPYGYFDSLKLIRELFEGDDFKDEFKAATSGFYINTYINTYKTRVGRNVYDDAVRLSYFTRNKEKAGRAEKVIKRFLCKNGRKIIFHDPHQLKGPASVLASTKQYYGGDQFQFRNFLHAYTQIGLNLIDEYSEGFRMLVAEYRLTDTPRGPNCRARFEPVFRKHSCFFRGLKECEAEQLWRDLNFWERAEIPLEKTPWDHFLVNMLLPGDPIIRRASDRDIAAYLKRAHRFLYRPEAKAPVTGRLREKMLEDYGLRSC